MSIIAETGVNCLGERIGASGVAESLSSMTLPSPTTSMNGEPKGIDVASGPFRILFSSSSKVPQLLRAMISTVSTHGKSLWQDVSPRIEFISSLVLAVRRSKFESWVRTLEGVLSLMVRKVSTSTGEVSLPRKDSTPGDETRRK